MSESLCQVDSTSLRMVEHGQIWRCACAGLCGLLAHGPLSHFWYLFCDNAIAELPVRIASLPLPSFSSSIHVIGVECWQSIDLLGCWPCHAGVTPRVVYTSLEGANDCRALQADAILL